MSSKKEKFPNKKKFILQSKKMLKNYRNNSLDEEKINKLNSRNDYKIKKQCLSTSNSILNNISKDRTFLNKTKEVIFNSKKEISSNQIKTNFQEKKNISSSSEDIIYNYSSFDSETEKSLKSKRAFSNSKEKNLDKISPQNFNTLIGNLSHIKLIAKDVEEIIKNYNTNPIFNKRKDYIKLLKLIIKDLEIIKEEQKKLQIERMKFEKEKEKFYHEVNSFKEYKKNFFLKEEEKNKKEINKNTNNLNKIGSYLKKQNYNLQKINLNKISNTQKNKSVSISKKENPILDNKSKENIFKKIKCNSMNHSKKGKFIDIKKSDSEKQFINSHSINYYPSFSSNSIKGKDSKNLSNDLTSEYNISKQNNFDIVFEEKYNLKDINILKKEQKNDRVIIFYDNNAKEIIYNSGVRQQIFPDDFKIIFFSNKDIKQIFPSGKYVYFFSQSKVTMTYLPKENIKIYKYQNGKIEINNINNINNNKVL